MEKLVSNTIYESRQSLGFVEIKDYKFIFTTLFKNVNDKNDEKYLINCL